MNLQEAQREFRSVFLGGSVGQFVTGMIWLISAALSIWGGNVAGIITLFLGGIFIFPLTQLSLRLVRGEQGGTLSQNNPLSQYFLHSVIAMGATYPLVYATTLYNTNWFYPAFMLVTGAHYLSFIMFYGMWQFGVLAAILVGSGISLAMLLPDVFNAGGWLTGIVLITFALIIWRTVVPKLSQPMQS